jgi:hypothetical protein
MRSAIASPLRVEALRERFPALSAPTVRLECAVGDRRLMGPWRADMPPVALGQGHHCRAQPLCQTSMGSQGADGVVEVVAPPGVCCRQDAGG